MYSKNFIMEPSPYSSDTLHDANNELEGLYALLLVRAVEEFRKRYSNGVNLKLYIFYFDPHEDQNVYTIAMIPKSKTDLSQGVYEIPDQGVWENGPGIEFLFSTETFELLKVTRMR